MENVNETNESNEAGHLSADEVKLLEELKGTKIIEELEATLKDVVS